MGLSLCIVGCGSYARTVLEDIHELTEELELFLASRDLNKARQYCETYGGAGFFGSYEEAASDPRVEAMYFLTPHHLHLENALLAVRHSKHILMEKPIARTIDESAHIIRAAKDAGVKLMVAENYRFLPTVQKCKELLTRGDVGGLRLIQAQVEHYRAPSEEWRSSADLRGGGGFIDGGIHVVDVMLNLGGFPERVYAARPPQVFGHVSGEDGIVVTAHLPNGAIGLITYSDATPISRNTRLISVTGSTGQLSFVPYGDEVSVETLEGRRTVRVAEARRGIRGMVREFRAMILEDREPVMSGEEGLKDLAVVLAAYESAEEGREVYLTPPQSSV